MNISKLFVAALLATAVGASAAAPAITLSGITGTVQIKTPGGIMTVKAGEPVPVIPSGAEIIVVSGDLTVTAGGVTVKAGAGDSFTVGVTADGVSIAVTGGLVTVTGADGVAKNVVKGEDVALAVAAAAAAKPAKTPEKPAKTPEKPADKAPDSIPADAEADTTVDAPPSSSPTQEAHTNTVSPSAPQ